MMQPENFAAGFYGYPLPWPAHYEPEDVYGYPLPMAVGPRFESVVSSSELTDEKTLAALRNHKEAEKRRRERINSHLDRLRALLPCSSKTDKATLLAMVVQRVRELNEETSKIMKKNGDGEGILIPSESDEFSVEDANDDDVKELRSNGEMILRASVCCEDRSDLFSDLTEVVNSLRLKTLRVEMSTLGGRTRNVLIVSGDQCRGREECAAFLHEALKGLVHRSGNGDRLKRRRRLLEPQAHA